MRRAGSAGPARDGASAERTSLERTSAPEIRSFAREQDDSPPHVLISGDWPDLKTVPRRTRGASGAAPFDARGKDSTPGTAPAGGTGRGAVTIIQGDNLDVARALPAGSFTLAYLDPPFNTGRVQERQIVTSTRREDTADGARRGFRGQSYERAHGTLRLYDDRFDDYSGFLLPRLEEAWRLLSDEGTLYVHLDYREAHYAKVMMDAVFGRDRFLNELIWAYDYGAKSRRRWPTKHDTILVYVKDPGAYVFDSTAVDREPYMAPGLVTPEKAARGKLPTDVWWHTIVPTSGREKTGYPTQKPEGILRRIVQASTRPGDRVLDLFAGSGTTGAVASALGRDAVLVDDNPEAVRVMRTRIPHAEVRSAG